MSFFNFFFKFYFIKEKEHLQTTYKQHNIPIKFYFNRALHELIVL